MIDGKELRNLVILWEHAADAKNDYDAAIERKAAAAGVEKGALRKYVTAIARVDASSPSRVRIP